MAENADVSTSEAVDAACEALRQVIDIYDDSIEKMTVERERLQERLSLLYFEGPR